MPASALVINLARRPDRLHRFTTRWLDADVGIALTVLDATDQTFHTPTDTRWGKYPLGTWGCWDSHVRALRQATGPVLVMEDDAVFAPRFAQIVAEATYPPGWDVIHLGGQHLVRPDPVVPGLVRPRRMARSHAYLSAYPQSLSARLRQTPTHVDHALGRLNLVRFCVDPWVVGQDDSPGDVTRLHPDHTDFWQEACRA